MKIILSPYLSPCQGRGRLVPVIAGLLLCSACSTVRHAPVVDRAAAEAEAVVEAPGQPVEDLVAEPDAGDDAGAAWVELPQPEDLEPQGEIRETEAPLLPDRVSDNPAVLALMDETDYRLGEGDAEAAASSVERALRPGPEKPGAWRRRGSRQFRGAGPAAGTEKPVAVASPCSFTVTTGALAPGCGAGGKVEFPVAQASGITQGQCRADRTRRKTD